MNIRTARKLFDELNAQILADGKVDIAEAHVLLDFVEDYADAGKEAFVEFRNLLLQCAKDKKITDEESAMLIRKMKEISAFLKFEQIVEWIFAGIVIAVIAFGLLTLI